MIALVRAANPSPLTLSGTNTWILGSAPAWVIDPGPPLLEHVDAVVAAVAERGGAGGIAVTHDHPDHAGALEELRARLGDPPVLAYGREVASPLRAFHVPGHAPDHLVFVHGAVAFTGDAVPGQGSVFIAPRGGSLRAYLDGLRELRALGLERLYPGHGPAVDDPAARLDELIAHRLERERRILVALADGARTDEELLAHAWDSIPQGLELPARWTLRAHLDKLREEGRLPDG